jgi:hypothetical protein
MFSREVIIRSQEHLLKNILFYLPELTYIVIFISSDSYKKALERLKRAEQTSNMESEEEGSRKRKRTQRGQDYASENGKPNNANLSSSN